MADMDPPSTAGGDTGTCIPTPERIAKSARPAVQYRRATTTTTTALGSGHPHSHRAWCTDLSMACLQFTLVHRVR
eukprot:1753993-Prymnesium_polylepis.1